MKVIHKLSTAIFVLFLIMFHAKQTESVGGYYYPNVQELADEDCTDMRLIELTRPFKGEL